MRSFHILDVKKFMSLFLISPDFDFFLFQEFELETSHRITISGKRNENWYSKDELEILEEQGKKSFLSWEDIRETIWEEIRGKKTPEFMRGVFMLPHKDIGEIVQKAGREPEDVHVLAWNLRYEKNELYLVTAVSMKIFTLDKSLEHTWDDYVADFLKKKEICYE